MRSGTTIHGTPAAGCRVLVLVLPDLPEVEAVLGQPGQHPRSSNPDDLLLIISSTSSPTGVQQLADQLAERTDGAVRVVDAPVSGDVDGANAGHAVDHRPVASTPGGAQAVAVLDACGTRCISARWAPGRWPRPATDDCLGPHPRARRGRRAGRAQRPRPGEALRPVGGGYAGGRILSTRGRRLVDQDYSPAGLAKYMIKDLTFASAVAEATGTNAVLLPILKQRLRATDRQRHGRLRHRRHPAVHRGTLSRRSSAR